MLVRVIPQHQGFIGIPDSLDVCTERDLEVRVVLPERLVCRGLRTAGSLLPGAARALAGPSPHIVVQFLPGLAQVGVAIWSASGCGC
jgi:hypothetical protein